MTRAPLLALAVALALGCAKEQGVEARPGGWVGEVGPDTVAGTVRQVGSTPFHRTVLQGEEGAVTVTGPLGDEITRLVGAEVRATGEIRGGSGPFGPELAATAYEIVSVDGERPYVGELEVLEDGYRLETARGGVLRIGAAPIRFRDLGGGRLWVTVDERGTVLRYGILRPPTEASEERPAAPPGSPGAPTLEPEEGPDPRRDSTGA